MSRQLTTDDARQSLRDHVTTKGQEIHARFGPHLGMAELNLLLNDRKLVRFPCTIAFDAAPLQPEEFAYPEPLGESPEAGYRICVHPRFAAALETVPALVLYQLVAVNYGDFATAEDAEAFGSAALGLSGEEYYQRLCAAADQLGGSPAPAGGGCGCHSATCCQG